MFNSQTQVIDKDFKMITILITIYLLSVLLTRWVMIRRIKKMKSYYPHGGWYLPLLNILSIFLILKDDFDGGKIYKWWTGDND
jgi:hydrogenase-4 membrane subunit HyfE